MIHAALSHLADQLNRHLKRSLELSEVIVVLSSPTAQVGAAAPNAANKLVLFLTNIARDTPSANTPTARPSHHLNLYVMVAANFGGDNYPEALRMLSAAVQFFQQNPVFDRQTTPDLDIRIEKLVPEIENLSVQELSSLWGTQGGKYLPSVLYKVRIVVTAPPSQTLEPLVRT